MPNREVVTLHIGQAGASTGAAFWEELRKEYNLTKDGQSEDNEPMKTFFDEANNGRALPRAIFFDTDPGSRDQLLAGSLKDFLPKSSLLAYKKDCKANYFAGRRCATEYGVLEMLLDKIAHHVEVCDTFQGFLLNYASGGGTGAGVTTELSAEIKDNYGKNPLFASNIFPSMQFASSSVEPYNCMFALADTTDTQDLTWILDNQSAYGVCRDLANVPNPSFGDVNTMLAAVMSASTLSLRKPSSVNATFSDILTNLVPQPRFRYGLLSLAPIRPYGAPCIPCVKRLVNELVNPTNFLADVTNLLHRNRYLSACVLLREDKPGAKVSVSGVHDALYSIQNSSVNRSYMTVVPWLAGHAIKVGILGSGDEISKKSNFNKNRRSTFQNIMGESSSDEDDREIRRISLSDERISSNKILKKSVKKSKTYSDENSDLSSIYNCNISEVNDSRIAKRNNNLHKYSKNTKPSRFGHLALDSNETTENIKKRGMVGKLEAILYSRQSQVDKLVFADETSKKNQLKKIKKSSVDQFVIQNDDFGKGILMANNTVIRSVFLRQYQKYLRLLYHGAYTWRFIEASGDLDIFDDTRNDIRELLADYEDILMESYTSETADNKCNKRQCFMGSSKVS